MSRKRRYKLNDAVIVFRGQVNISRAPRVYHKKPFYCEWNEKKNTTICYYR